MGTIPYRGMPIGTSGLPFGVTFYGSLVYSGCGRKVNVGSTGLYIVKVSGEIHKVIVK